MTAPSTLVRVKAFPDAPKERVEETAPHSLRIFVRQPAERNLANMRIRQIIALRYGVPIAQVRIRTGARSPHKTFELP